MRYVTLFSGGHASALTAVEAVRKFGSENVILLNHNISPKVEDQDIKRFKEEVAQVLGVPLVYANMKDWETTTPLDVCVKHRAFTGNGNRGNTICTYHLKTAPFYHWLKEFYPVRKGCMRKDVCFLYGFQDEPKRLSRRIDKMSSMGYLTDYPLTWKERTCNEIEEIGIKRPRTYGTFRHANCCGCLKAGASHFYAVYCLRPDLFYEAVKAERIIGHSIIKGRYLSELEYEFRRMKSNGVVPTDATCCHSFWKVANSMVSGQYSMF